MEHSEQSKRIAELNDQFRRTLGNSLPGQEVIPGHVVMTQGIAALGEERQFVILKLVREFDAFTPDNDPWGEHDFAILAVEGVGSVYWKIDYYDPTLTYGSENPTDLTATMRVLTLLLPSEY